jgi:hypothetical protein
MLTSMYTQGCLIDPDHSSTYFEMINDKILPDLKPFILGDTNVDRQTRLNFIKVINSLARSVCIGAGER